jgi:hypothetical protein
MTPQVLSATRPARINFFIGTPSKLREPPWLHRDAEIEIPISPEEKKKKAAGQAARMGDAAGGERRERVDPHSRGNLGKVLPRTEAAVIQR